MVLIATPGAVRFSRRALREGNVSAGQPYQYHHVVAVVIGGVQVRVRVATCPKTGRNVSVRGCTRATHALLEDDGACAVFCRGAASPFFVTWQSLGRGNRGHSGSLLTVPPTEVSPALLQRFRPRPCSTSPSSEGIPPFAFIGWNR